MRGGCVEGHSLLRDRPPQRPSLAPPRREIDATHATSAGNVASGAPWRVPVCRIALRYCDISPNQSCGTPGVAGHGDHGLRRAWTPYAARGSPNGTTVSGADRGRRSATRPARVSHVTCARHADHGKRHGNPGPRTAMSWSVVDAGICGFGRSRTPCTGPSGRALGSRSRRFRHPHG